MVQIVQSPSTGQVFGESLLNVLNKLGPMLEQKRKNKLLGELLSGGPVSSEGIPTTGAPVQRQLSPDKLLGAARAAGASPQDLMLLQRQLAQQETQQYRKEKLGLEKERAETAEATPYLTSLRKRLEPARDLSKPVEKALSLLNDPSVNLQIGAIKSLTPSRAQNAETQEFVALLNEIVLQKAQLGKGVAHKGRLELEKLAKADTWQNPKAIRNILNNLNDQIGRTFQENDIAHSIIEKYKGKKPRNLETLVEKTVKQIKNLPPANEFTEDTIVEVDGNQYRPVGNTWQPVGE